MNYFSGQWVSVGDRVVFSGANARVISAIAPDNSLETETGFEWIRDEEPGIWLLMDNDAIVRIGEPDEDLFFNERGEGAPL